MTIKELKQRLDNMFPSGYRVKGRFTGGVIKLAVSDIVNKDRKCIITLNGLKKDIDLL